MKISLGSIRNKKRSKQMAFVAMFMMLLALDFVALNFISGTKENLSTTQADALYGGTADISSHQYAGYILDYSGLFRRQVCGITFLSPNVGVSAAHCFEEDGLYFAGFGELRTEPIYNLAIEKYEFDDAWDRETLSGDIAIVSIGESSVGMQQYAQISTPRVGCNYEVLAYGSTDQDVLTNADLRRKSNVCIESVSADRFYLSSPDGGICFGDSGSPIFSRGTNKIVGIVSAITADNEKYSEENCYVNNRAVATRLDSNLNFISSTQEPLIATSDCPMDSNQLCDEGEKCRSNKCRQPSDYAYSSTIDYRSADFIFGDYFSMALIVVLGLVTFGFLLIVYRSFTRTYG